MMLVAVVNACKVKFLAVVTTGDTNINFNFDGMPIVVKIEENNRPAEWAIIELQGDLKTREDSTLHSQFIGDLHYTTKGVPVLIIGHHILYGKEVTMEKPFAVAERVCDTNDTSKNTEFIVRAVVKRKLLFKTRPKPIIPAQSI